MIATVERAPPEATNFQSEVIIVIDESRYQGKIAQILKDWLVKLGVIHSRIVRVRDVEFQDLDHGHCIFLPEIQSSFFVDITEVFFSALKKMLLSASMVLCVTGATEKTANGPSAGMMPGFARTFKSENPGIKVVTVSLEGGHDIQHVVDHVLRVYEVSATADSTLYDPEYEELKGILCTNRVVEAEYLDRAVQSLTGTHSSSIKTSLQNLGQLANRQLCLRISSPGLIDTLEFADDNPIPIRLAPDKIEVEIRATGLGFRDVLIASGLYKAASFGLEYAGIVINAGSATSSKTGDRVYGWTHGSFRTHARCKDGTSLPIPDGMSFTTAVAFLVGHCTAYHSLVNVARFRRNESVLIHSGAGATGQVAIQMAKHFDADIYVTDGTLEKKALITEAYGILPDHVFSSRTLAFQKGIKRLTEGRGVDVVLNSLTDEAFYASIDCLAPFGRFIEIGR